MIARNPRTVITAIAQCGKPGPAPSGWTDPVDDDEGEVGEDEWMRVEDEAADAAADAADRDESTEADEAEADEAEAAAAEREEMTESKKVVSVTGLRVRRMGQTGEVER